MKSFKCLFALLALLAVFALAGCAGIMSTIPTPDELHRIRGMSKEAVLEKFGQPSDKSKDGNNWYYKKPTNNTINNIVLVSSFGLLNGKNSVYMDVAKISFKNGRVHSTNIMDDNVNLNFSSLGLASDYASDLDVPYQRDSDGSRERNTAKNIVSSAASSIGLSSMMPSGFHSTSSHEKVAADQTPENKSAPKPSLSNSTIRQANLFQECSLKDAKKRICANAKKLGFAVVQKKDGKVNITSRDGIKVATSFKQVGKDVIVELSSISQFSDTFSNDLCKVVERCN